MKFETEKKLYKFPIFVNVQQSPSGIDPLLVISNRVEGRRGDKERSEKVKSPFFFKKLFLAKVEFAKPFSSFFSGQKDFPLSFSFIQFGKVSHK